MKLYFSQIYAYLQQDLQQADTQFSQIKPIHKTPNKLIRLSTNLRLFETGIKVVDLLTPYVQGGKIDFFGGAGVGKTVVIMELIRIQVLYLVQICHHLRAIIFSTQVHKYTLSTPIP